MTSAVGQWELQLVVQVPPTVGWCQCQPAPGTKIYSRGKLTFPRLWVQPSLTSAQIPRYFYLLVVPPYWSTRMMHPIFPDFQHYDTDAFEQLCPPSTPVLPCLIVCLSNGWGALPKSFLR